MLCYQGQESEGKHMYQDTYPDMTSPLSLAAQTNVTSFIFDRSFKFPTLQLEFIYWRFVVAVQREAIK